MSTMPGAAVIPAHYGEDMVLYSAVERVDVVVDGAPPRENGRLFTVMPGKSARLPYEAGRFILDHFKYTGVVRVREEWSDDGVKYDIEGAKRESEALLAEQDERRFFIFVNSAREDYLSKNKPVPPPSQSIIDIIGRRGYDLKKYGIVPMGWEEPQKDKRLAQMESEIKVLKEMLEDATRPKKEK